MRWQTYPLILLIVLMLLVSIAAIDAAPTEHHSWETVAVTCEHDRAAWEQLARDCAVLYSEREQWCHP